MRLLKNRLQKVRETLKKAKTQAMLVTSVHNVRYLSGFTGDECCLLITEKENLQRQYVVVVVLILREFQEKDLIRCKIWQKHQRDLKDHMVVCFVADARGML